MGGAASGAFRSAIRAGNALICDACAGDQVIFGKGEEGVAVHAGGEPNRLSPVSPAVAARGTDLPGEK